MNAPAAFGGAAANEKLRAVEFRTIPGRVGQRIRNELIFAAHGGDEISGERLYFLDVAIQERKISSLVQADGDELAEIYILDAQFRVLRASDSKVVLTGTSVARAALRSYSSIYANVRARRDAEDRAAKTIAQDLKGRLEAFLATPA